MTRNEYKQYLARRLTNVRIEHGMSRYKIASLLDITSAAYLSYENGYVMPDVYELISLAHFYKISVSNLLGDTSDISDIK